MRAVGLRLRGGGDADADDSAHYADEDRQRLVFSQKRTAVAPSACLDPTAGPRKHLTEFVTVGKLLGSRKYEGLGQARGSRGRVRPSFQLLL